MKPSTSKTSSLSHSPPPEEPTVPYVNDNLPNPENEPCVSDISLFELGEERHRQKSKQAAEKYGRIIPALVADQRAVTGHLFHRYTEDEERKRLEQQKNKEAMSASAAPTSRNGHIGENRKRRNDAVAQPTEEDWRRVQQQQHWMAQSQMPNGFHLQQQQFLHQQQQQQQQYLAHQSVPTPASMHQPSPVEMQNVGDRLSAVDENILNVPDGKWFDELAEIVAENYNADTVLGPDTYDTFLNELESTEPIAETSKSPMEKIIDRIPSAATVQNPQQLAQQQQQHQNKMRLLQQQQQEQQQQLQQQEMQRLEQQRQQQQQQQQILQQQHQQRQQQQMLLQQQQMQQHNQMNGAQFAQAQQAAYMQQMQRMHHIRYQQQQHQQQQLHQLPQPHQNAAMGYGIPNGYPQQMHMHHAPPYAHHMPQHTPFANIN
ncbi:CRE-SEL-8 protein [Caenorhabditis remanei]|uniref:CRE-SEL-8 protein n=1 Tax=Caenorhabditis remanei TaxID=31234 RepID=E3LT94_CAERE|nr:CRE-SEL-8 protein [Caenorhabditis remanei]